MSVRIYTLSKQLELSNKDLIALLNQKGFKVDSPSNTIPDADAEALVKEWSKQKAPQSARISPTTSIKVEASAAKPDPGTKRSLPDEENQKPLAQAPLPVETAPAKENRPALSNFVKSATQVAEERELRAPQAPIAGPSSLPSVPKKPAVVTVVPPSPFQPNVAPKVPFRPTPPPFAFNKTPPVPGLIAPKSIEAPPSDPIQEQSATRLIQLKPPIVVRDFAVLLGLKPFRLISELMEMGIFASMNQPIEEEVALKIAKKYGFDLDIRHRGETSANAQKAAPAPKPQKAINLTARPPVVCVLGHVDHGKTSLLDAIRQTNVTAGEAGGITQHIGAYQVSHKGQKITFIDTPGHAAFSKMRERGANVTDIAILVVAADDGFMPQTEEALKFAQKANVPVIVAINKMDAKGANIERVKQQMQQKGISSEDWGGETLCTPISAIKKQNIDELLELVLLQAEMLELKADAEAPSEGTVMESQIELGRGPTASVIIQAGTLKVGSALVCGGQYCKVRSLMDSNGKPLKEAPPATPVRITGWSGTLEAGATYRELKNEKEAKIAAEANLQELKDAEAKAKKGEKMDVNDLFLAIANTQQKYLRLLIKGDVHGSVEALKNYLETIQSSKVNLEVLEASVGTVTPSDVMNAKASGATILGFNTKLENGVQSLLKQQQIPYIQHNIIYELIDQVRDAMAELLDPEFKENKLGAAQVRQIFPLGKSFVAGSMVTEGLIKREAKVRVLRAHKVIENDARIITLKRFKEDVNEVRAGYECGIQLNNFDHFKEGDLVECYEIVKVKPSL